MSMKLLTNNSLVRSEYLSAYITCYRHHSNNNNNSNEYFCVRRRQINDQFRENAFVVLNSKVREYVELYNNQRVNNTLVRFNAKNNDNDKELDHIVKRAPLAEWRVFKSKEELERIDLLTYWLKRYPEDSEEERQAETKKRKVSAKAAKLDELCQKRVKLTRPSANVLEQPQCTERSSNCGNLVHSNQQINHVNFTTMTAKDLMKSSASSRPFTSYAEVRKLAIAAEREWSDEELESKIAEEQERVEWERLTTHPEALFANETAILSRFGMGKFVSPHVSGFDGLFRQSWLDFHVTEMINDYASHCGGVPLSRSYSFAIPSMPSWLTHTGTCTSCSSSASSTPHLTCRENVHRTSNAGKLLQHGGEEVDKSIGQSFFTVNVKERINAIKKETVAEEDRLAARNAMTSQYEKEEPCQEEYDNGTSRLVKESIHSSETHVKNNNIGVVLEQHESSPPPLPEEEKEELLSLSPALAKKIAHLCALSQKEDELLATARMASNKVDHCVYRSSSLNDQVGSSDDTNTCANTFHLQCTLHKEHVAHPVALSTIAQILRIHPRAITVSGIKDYIGDTVQRVRLEKVSPYAAYLANSVFREKKCNITLSDFSYEQVPLSAGDHFGNHFHIVLRDVVTTPQVIHDAMSAFHTRGFPNYYGCQRFSWFGGVRDAAFAMLQNDWLVFAFRFLNYTDTERTMRELLQREPKYPHAVQDEYRRNVVRRLRHIAIEPVDLDHWPFTSCPSIGETMELRTESGNTLGLKLETILDQFKEAYLDLDYSSRRLTAQRLSSYLWNQVLTLRLHHFGGTEVLCGDFVASAQMRQLSHSLLDRREWYSTYGNVVTECNKTSYTIKDVIHPGFSFNNIVLPENAVGYYYHQICDKYRLDWGTLHTKSGLTDFMEPARPIVRFPIDLKYSYDESHSTLTVDFALERGCYANVAITELLKATRCMGSEEITCVPVPNSLWDSLGEKDPGYVASFQDIYEGYEDGCGFVNDTETIPFSPHSEIKVWDYKGPLFMSPKDDPVVKARKWGKKNLLRNMQRRIVDAERLKRELFERPLAKQVSDDELSRYAGHTVPLPPNVSGKKVFHKILRRKRRYVGAPKVEPRVKMGAVPVRRQSRLKPFKTLDRGSWNVTW